MNDITKTILNASMKSISHDDENDDLYEPNTLDEDVAEVALETPIDELYPVAPKKRVANLDEEGYYDPYPPRHHKSAEAEMQDRLLTIPIRPKNAPWGSLWLAHTNFIEQIALINITKSEQRGLLRVWEDIQVLSEGDGNEDIVEAEQDKFMMKIVSYKSRSDNPEKGTRERTAHITNKTITDQTIQMPKSEAQKSGFLNTILGRQIK